MNNLWYDTCIILHVSYSCFYGNVFNHSLTFWDCMETQMIENFKNRLSELLLFHICYLSLISVNRSSFLTFSCLYRGGISLSSWSFAGCSVLRSGKKSIPYREWHWQERRTHGTGTWNHQPFQMVHVQYIFNHLKKNYSLDVPGTCIENTCVYVLGWRQYSHEL